MKRDKYSETVTSFVVLAAGKGTRMKSALPKVLHPVAGLSMLGHVLTTTKALNAQNLVVVTGHESVQVTQAVTAVVSEASCVEQSPQLGTAHAVLQAKEALQGVQGDVFILYADTPLICPETLQRMAQARRDGAAVVVLGFETDQAGAYGRLVTTDQGLEAIVEAKEATPEQLAIRLCNSGVMCVDGGILFDLLDKVDNHNAKGEYYLTDLVALARAAELRCEAVLCEESEVQGVNNKVELAQVEAAWQTRRRVAAMLDGAMMMAPETVFFHYDTQIQGAVMIEPNVVFAKGVSLSEGATIRAFSHLEGCHVAQNAVIGPYARLRPGAQIGENCRIGNFVEVKNASLAQGAKVNHLSYIGDAQIGEKANIGAGTITCNYDGYNKSRTEIGADAFIGSNSALVAPVAIGDGVTVAAGSVITQDVPKDALAVGRSRQVNKADLAAKLRRNLQKS